MNIIDGKAVAASVRSELKEEVARFTQINRKITLAVVMIGDNPASAVYVRNKTRACEEVGILSVTHFLSGNVTQQEALALIHSLAENNSVDGILLQLPVPKHLNEQELLDAIPPDKDVDGFSKENIGKLLLGNAEIVACTPLGVMELLKRYNIPLAGKNAVVVGRSNIVGKPMAMLLLGADATVTVCHSKTKNLKEICLNADVLVVAVGKSKLITGDMVKQGAVVIDVGMNRTEQGLCGDVDFESVKARASYITPVPGGVGPMTVAMLMKNVLMAAQLRSR